MSKVAKVCFHNKEAGVLQETENGYQFQYEPAYLRSKDNYAISKTLPLQEEVYSSNVLFPFFDGLIPEGWLLDIALDNWKLQERDRFEILLVCCKSTIGAVSIIPLEDSTT